MKLKILVSILIILTIGSGIYLWLVRDNTSESELPESSISTLDTVRDSYFAEIMQGVNYDVIETSGGACTPDSLACDESVILKLKQPVIINFSTVANNLTSNSWLAADGSQLAINTEELSSDFGDNNYSVYSILGYASGYAATKNDVGLKMFAFTESELNKGGDDPYYILNSEVYKSADFDFNALLAGLGPDEYLLNVSFVSTD